MGRLFEKKSSRRIKICHLEKQLEDKTLRNVNITETLPTLIVKSDEHPKVGLRVDERKQVSFTNLYRKAVINKGLHDELEMNRKEMEFMGLSPSTCSQITSSEGTFPQKS